MSRLCYVPVHALVDHSLGLTVYEVATRTELPGDGEDWHAMRDGRAIGLPPSRSRELGAVLRQVGVCLCVYVCVILFCFCWTRFFLLDACDVCARTYLCTCKCWLTTRVFNVYICCVRPGDNRGELNTRLNKNVYKRFHKCALKTCAAFINGRPNEKQ